MIPIVREFFRGLGERHELDAIVPELLTAMGYEVVSRPMTGTRQYGADVAAVGSDEDGVRKLFLFVIKKGDLTREEWDGTPQAVRPSLNDVRDAYLSGLAPAHKGLPVVVCITIGGIVRENVQRSVNGYMAVESRGGIEFRVWSGDTLTTKIVDGALREEIFPPALRNRLRRAAALVDEPEAAFQQFARLIEEVATNETLDAVARVRILYLALWIFMVWGREGGNLEAPYRASERVVLRSWALLYPAIGRDKGRKLTASHSFRDVVELHWLIWDALYRDKILPHAGQLHALSFAAWSQEPLDINLALFETVGRVAMGGLWQAWLETQAASPPVSIDRPGQKLSETAQVLAELIENNPALNTPRSDDQAIDITLALVLLSIVPETRDLAAFWVSQIANSTIIAFDRRTGFPTIETNYAFLIRQPAQFDDELRKEATAGSILYPVLAMFARAFGNDALVAELGRFQSNSLDHSNFQTWVPNARTEDRLWRGQRNGSGLGGLTIGDDCEDMVGALRREIKANSAYRELSAIRLDHWPLLLLACRCHRYPPPPQTWLPLLDSLLDQPSGSERPMGILVRLAGSTALYRSTLMHSVSGIPFLAGAAGVEQ